MIINQKQLHFSFFLLGDVEFALCEISFLTWYNSALVYSLLGHPDLRELSKPKLYIGVGIGI